MIALGSRNQLGNVLHIVAGPESDLHADLYGAVVMDITDILQHMDPEQRVLISLTRGRPERTVDQQLTLGQIPTAPHTRCAGSPRQLLGQEVFDI